MGTDTQKLDRLKCTMTVKVEVRNGILTFPEFDFRGKTIKPESCDSGNNPDHNARRQIRAALRVHGWQITHGDQNLISLDYV